MNNEDNELIGNLVIQHREQQCRMVCVQEKQKKLISALNEAQTILEDHYFLMKARATNNTLFVDPDPAGGTSNRRNTKIEKEYPDFEKLKVFISEYQEATKTLEETRSQLKKIDPIFSKFD